MKTRYLLLTGACGSGKTWVAKELIRQFNMDAECQSGLYRFRSDDFGRKAVLGFYDGTTFEGSDKLSMAVMASNAEAKFRLDEFDVVFAEGDRFTNATFIRDFNPEVIKISDSGAKGREVRGSSQTERHIRAISTRVNNLTADFVVPDSRIAFGIIAGMMDDPNYYPNAYEPSKLFDL